MNVLWFSLLFSLGFIFVILDLVRRQRLKEQYSLLWLLIGLGFLVVSSNTKVLEWMALLLDIKYAPAVLFLLGLIFSFALILHLTVVISRLTDHVLRLTQEITVLKTELSERETAMYSPLSASGSSSGIKQPPYKRKEGRP